MMVKLCTCVPGYQLESPLLRRAPTANFHSASPFGRLELSEGTAAAPDRSDPMTVHFVAPSPPLASVSPSRCISPVALRWPRCAAPQTLLTPQTGLISGTAAAIHVALGRAPTLGVLWSFPLPVLSPARALQSSRTRWQRRIDPTVRRLPRLAAALDGQALDRGRYPRASVHSLVRLHKVPSALRVAYSPITPAVPASHSVRAHIGIPPRRGRGEHEGGHTPEAEAGTCGSRLDTASGRSLRARELLRDVCAGGVAPEELR
ncbi:hypothetical protein VTO73DRAFT_9249 [Trametes versicolor]